MMLSGGGRISLDEASMTTRAKATCRGRGGGGVRRVEGEGSRGEGSGEWGEGSGGSGGSEMRVGGESAR